MKVEKRKGLLFLVVTITLFAVNVSSFADSYIWISSLSKEVPSGKTTIIDIQVHFRGEQFSGKFKIDAEAPEYLGFQLLTREVDGTISRNMATVKAEVSPPRSIYRKQEKVTLRFTDNNRVTTKFLHVRISSISWFWPLVGSIIGVSAILVFIAVFRRISKGD